MAWYDTAVFYHIYPLGLTNAPQINTYEEPVHRLNTLVPWVEHIAKLGCNALYIGPLFESVGHGYETTDYKKLDSRLGTNEDLIDFVKKCHDAGIKVVLDGVFNHTGRDFFAFKDIIKNRENSSYKDWYCNVNFYGNNEYNDGFSYENWGGYNLLVKLNQHNPAVRDYICDVIRFWIKEFDIDGIRLDAADVLDFGYMQAMRATVDSLKSDFWLMGEVIHGEFTRWVNNSMLHSLTNYSLHKALYSGHNDHNYFEIAHTVKRLCDMGGSDTVNRLYNFVDNHDVERIYTKLINKQHFIPVHILLYTLPGIPSIYYGSEFAIDGKKERGSDASLRPALALSDYADYCDNNPYTKLICALGKIRQQYVALSLGDYNELLLTNRQYAFARKYNNCSLLIAVNNDDAPAHICLPAEDSVYFGLLSGRKIQAADRLEIDLLPNSGDIFVTEENKDIDVNFQLDSQTMSAIQECSSENLTSGAFSSENLPSEAFSSENSFPDDCSTESAIFKDQTTQVSEHNKEAIDRAISNPDAASTEDLQCAILAKMASNGPLNDQMRRTVYENVYHDSLVNWLRSFH